MATVYQGNRPDRAAVVQRPSTIPATLAPRSTLVAMPGLRHWRIARALTQGDLAEQAGLNRVTVGRLETGTPARMSTVRKLAEVLGVAPTALMRQPSVDTQELHRAAETEGDYKADPDLPI